MRSCSSCGSQSPDHARFCGHCGKRISSPQQDQVATKETLQRPFISPTIVERERANVKTEKHRQASIYNSIFTSPLHFPKPSMNGTDPHHTEHQFQCDAPTILASQRQMILDDLLSLIAFVDEARRATNQEQFEHNAATMPPVEDDSWGRIAFITGIYGRYMWKHPLSKAQKKQMWRALIWAVRYEQYFRPKMANDRSAELFIFLNGVAGDQCFLSYAVQDVLILIEELHLATIKKLGERLVKLSQVPQDIVGQFRAAIEKRLASSPQGSEPPAANSQEIIITGHSDARKSSTLKRPRATVAKQQDSAYHACPPLTFLGEEREKEFLSCIRDSQLDRIEQILQDARQPLLSALTRVLAVTAFDEMQPPRRTFHIRDKNGVDLFPHVRTQITSSEPDLWRETLAVFEQGERETTHKDFKMIAREWLLFAQARVNGPLRVVPRWEEHRRQGTASWEEIWNLAAFYVKIHRLAQALEILEPGISVQQAPFSHLRFALYCGAQMLAHADTEQAATTIEQAISFLLRHLTKLPYPICYLAWLLLTHERQEKQDFIERLQVLSLFQEILEHPVMIPQPEALHDDATLEIFEKEMRYLKLDATWYIWIVDYAERHPYNRKAWQSLAETCEYMEYLEQGEKALQHIAKIQLEQHQRHIHKGLQPPDIRYLRATLIKLFEFYRRHEMMANSNAAFNMYYRAIPELWDSHTASNKLLIDLTHPHMEGNAIACPGNLPGDTVQTWLNLQAALSNVNELDMLKDLQPRLDAAIDLIIANQKSAREGAVAMKQLLDEICRLDTISWQRQDLENEVRQLNEKIEDIQHLLKREPALITFKALIAAIQRVFEIFSAMQQLVPALHVQLTPVGPGLPYDQSETALVIRLGNPGPGKVTNIQVTCNNSGHVTSRKAGPLASIAEQSEGLVAIPVIATPTHTLEPVMCNVHLTYQWGIIHDLSSTHTLAVSWYNFHDFLHQHHISDYEFPIPYVFDAAIDFNKHDRRLFQGREQEINLVRNLFLKRQMTGTPLYFHGIRKVGKTSLLHRICLELKQGHYIPVVVDLHGIKATQQSLHIIINTFTTRILNTVKTQGLDVVGIEPVPVTHPNPIIGVETFFWALHERAGHRQIVLLLDEFHVIVAKRTTPLLDLLWRIHQSDIILFIMSGWLRPEPLQRACPETQLFPLIGRPIGYLSFDAVRQVLRVPITDYGITIPEETIERVYVQTAGNPYHVAKLASFGIAQLNAEHRTVLTPQDVDEIAASLARDPANFTSSSFSPLIFTPEEQSTAVRFARELGNQRNSLPVEAAMQQFGFDLIRGLEEKYILERRDERFYIKSNMLALYLQTRVGNQASLDQHATTMRRVGIFVDYENLLPLLPSNMKSREVGEALRRYAAQFGEIACSWACADPRNIPDATGMQLGLEQAGFMVYYPRGEPHIGPAAKNVTDFALLERITEESMHSGPETYILVSGDRDYYEKITTLLNRGNTVRLVASWRDGHLASKYRRLQEQRTQIRYAEGYTEADFFIDNLDDII